MRKWEKGRVRWRVRSRRKVKGKKGEEKGGRGGRGRETT